MAPIPSDEEGGHDDGDRVQALEQEVQQLKVAVGSHPVADQATGMTAESAA